MATTMTGTTGSAVVQHDTWGEMGEEWVDTDGATVCDLCLTAAYDEGIGVTGNAWTPDTAAQATYCTTFGNNLPDHGCDNANTCLCACKKGHAE